MVHVGFVAGVVCVGAVAQTAGPTIAGRPFSYAGKFQPHTYHCFCTFPGCKPAFVFSALSGNLYV
jgi:hypothetical protein